MVLEIDVKPLATRAARAGRRQVDEPGSDAATPMSPRNHHIQQEGMFRAVPGNIEPAHQSTPIPGAYPAEAVTVNLRTPVPLAPGPVLEALCMKVLHFGAIERATPLVPDLVSRHGDRMQRVGALAKIGRSSRAFYGFGF